MHGLKQWARDTLRALKASRARRLPPPEVIEDPRDAIVRFSRGERVAMAGPIEDCVIFNGLSFASRGFHPFAAAADELLASPGQGYQGSCLQAYYARWQPADALEALIGAPTGPAVLRSYPPYLMLAPWLDISIEDRLEWIHKTMRWEGKEPGGEAMGPEDGHGLQGPVSERKGAAEHARLKNVLDSVRSRGYDRREGDLAAQVLVRGTELRFRIVHGHHRAGAVRALGADTFIVQPSAVIEIEAIDQWRHVRSGAWSRTQAEAYFHHHFDFDSGAWARGLGLGKAN